MIAIIDYKMGNLRSVENALQAIDNDIHYKGWYFGHWHLDFDYKRYHALYNRVVRIL